MEITAHHQLGEFRMLWANCDDEGNVRETWPNGLPTFE